MTQKYTIHVTQTHIDEAIRRYKSGINDLCGNCPIAIAAQEQIGPDYRVTLSSIYEPVSHNSFDLPNIGKQITATLQENWHTLQPTSFEIESSK